MNKRTSRYKGKRKAHYYSLAGALNSLSPTFGENGIQQTGFGKGLGLNEDSIGLVGGLASATGGIANSAISGGLSSGAGNAITGIGSTVGSALSTVNPLLGGAVSLASNVLGGLTNAAFGSKMNNQKIAEVNTSNAAIANTQVDDSSNVSVLNQWAGQDWGSNFSQRDIGKDGWFSKKAKRKYQQLKREQELARAKAYNSYDNAIENADVNQDMLLMQNYAAYGGPLSSNGTIWDNGITFINNGGSHEANPYEGVQVGVDQQGVPNLVEEGEVIWNDYVFSERLKVPKAFKDKYKLKGKDAISFAEAAEKFAEESKERPNDPISKRGRDTMLSLLMDQQEEVRMKKQQRQAKAQFNSLSPEEQLGIMQMAQQNAMPAGPEEGMNNIEGYPMYNQGAPLMAAYGGELGNVFRGEGDKPNKMTRRYNLEWFKNKAKDLGFDLGDDFEVDPINYTANLDEFNKRYRDYQYQRARDTYIAGQRQSRINEAINSERYKRSDNGQNVYAAKYYGDAEAGKDYINAAGNRITSDEYSKLKKADQANYNYRQAVKGQFMRDYYGNIIYDYDNDVSNTYIPDNDTLAKDFKWDDKDALKVSYGPKELSGADNFLRYAPAIGSAIGFADSMFTKPDYTSSNILMDAAVREGTANPIGYNPVGNYMSYKPFDRNFYTNKLSAEAGATRRAILNSSSPSRNAALLAADFNAQGKLGDLARQAEEYNLAQRQKVEDFNRGTNITNSEMALKTAMANMEENRRAKAAYTNNLTKAIALREQEDQQLAASRNANFNNFITNLGQIGEEAYNRNMIEALIDRGTLRDLYERVKANGNH